VTDIGEYSINDLIDIVFDSDTTVVLDTGVIMACGKPTNEKFVALASFAGRIENPLVIPQRVHDELGGSPEGYSASNMAVDLAIEQGWLRIFNDLDYTNPKLSQVMDDVRNYGGVNLGVGARVDRQEIRSCRTLQPTDGTDTAVSDQRTADCLS
jgi:hypothetical protein